ncbi:MAG: alginate export family protein [Bacteroidales bacterium]
MNRIFLLVGTLILFTSTGLAQGEKFSLTGTIRPRYELRDGYKSMLGDNDKASSFISQRTRLNALYNDGKVSAKLVIQDVSTWGDKPQLALSDYNGFGFHEAWGAYEFTEGLKIKAGRQEFNYDDVRILGNVDWAQQARSHDGALFQFTKVKDLRIDLGLAYNRQGELNTNTYYDLAGYKAMQFLWANYQSDKFYGSFLFLNNGVQDSSGTDLNIKYSQTIGFYLKSKNLKGWGYSASAYYQGGKLRGDTKLSAYYFAASLNKRIAQNFSGTLGFEVLSGNDQGSTDTKNKAFTPLYGTNHKFNGHMDYFYVGNHGNSVGLGDYYLTLKYAKNKFTTALTGHYFTSMGDILDKDSKVMDNYLGFELDWMIGYKFTDNFNLSAGYSRMFAGDALNQLKSGDSARDNANWAYIMLSFTPKFLSL